MYIYLTIVAWNEGTRLQVPKTKYEFFDDFERQKHASFKKILKVECKLHPRTNNRVSWGAVELCCFKQISRALMVNILVCD